MPEPIDEVTRLREIEGAMTRERFEAQRAHEGWDVAPVTDDAGMRGADAIGCAALRDVAPSMLAVIEALVQGDALEAMRIRHDAFCVEGPCYCEVDIQRAADALDAFRASVREEQERG